MQDLTLRLSLSFWEMEQVVLQPHQHPLGKEARVTKQVVWGAHPAPRLMPSEQLALLAHNVTWMAPTLPLLTVTSNGSRERHQQPSMLLILAPEQTAASPHSFQVAATKTIPKIKQCPQTPPVPDYRRVFFAVRQLAPMVLYNPASYHCILILLFRLTPRASSPHFKFMVS